MIHILVGSFYVNNQVFVFAFFLSFFCPLVHYLIVWAQAVMCKQYLMPHIHFSHHANTPMQFNPPPPPRNTLLCHKKMVNSGIHYFTSLITSTHSLYHVYVRGQSAKQTNKFH